MKSSLERRHFSRINFDGQCTVCYQQQKYRAKLVDIGLSGVKIQSTSQLNFALHEPAHISISLTDSTASIDFKASLVKHEHDLLHFKIDHIDIHSSSHLRRLLELNLGDASLLKRELHNLVHDITVKTS